MQIPALKKKEGKVWKAGLSVFPPARSSSTKAGWLSSKEQRAEHITSLLEFPSHTHMRDTDSAGKQLPSKIRMTNPQQRRFIYFKGHKAELFPEASAFVNQQAVGRGSPGTHSCSADRSNHRNTAGLCGPCVTHADMAGALSLMLLARPDPTAWVTPGSLCGL